MSQLMQHYADDDFLNETKPLVLSNPHHPRNARTKHRISGATAAFFGRSGPKPPLCSLPVDLFQCIADYLEPTDLLCLSYTCTALQDSATVQQATYWYPFRRCHLGVNDHKDFVRTHKATSDSLIRGIDDITGVYIEKLSLWEWATIKDLQHIIKHCPNLKSIDSIRVVEPIDFTRYRRYGRSCGHGYHGTPLLEIPAEEAQVIRDKTVEWHSGLEVTSISKPNIETEMARCHACSDRFQWPLIIKYCPKLFENLTSIRMTYSGARHEGHKDSIQGRKQLPKLLDLASRLQILEFDGFERYGSYKLRADFDECVRFKNAILEHASSELQVLGLHDMNFIIENPSNFLLAMEKFPKLWSLNLSLHSDLKRHKFAPNVVTNATTSPFEYIASLRLATERGWTIITTDSEQSRLIRPWPFFHLSHAKNLDHLQWLLHSPIQWKPVFKWRGYMYENFVKLAPRSKPQIIENDYLSIRALFSELRAAKAPVRLLLETPGYEDGFFSWQMDDLPSDASTPYFLGSSRIGKSAHAWRLDTIGDLVDDLRLCWRWNHVFGREAFWQDPVISTPEVASKSVMAHLARTRELLEKRLKYEAEHIAPFFRKLHHYCPNLTRLALFIPGPLYPDHDAKFIHDILPGDGWRVKHHGTGFGDEMPEAIDTPLDEGDQRHCGYDTDDEEAETEKEINRRRKVSVKQIWNMMAKVEEERLPMLHRVFTRTLKPDGSAVPVPLPEGECYKTPRGANLQCFDVTSIEVKRNFNYLWGDPVSKPDASDSKPSI